jgi:hypothetical protein
MRILYPLDQPYTVQELGSGASVNQQTIFKISLGIFRHHHGIYSMALLSLHKKTYRNFINSGILQSAVTLVCEMALSH